MVTNASSAISEVLVVGIGNLLMGDDGVGCRIAARLQEDPPEGARVLDAGTASMRLLQDFEQAGALLFLDALATGATAGTLHVMDARELAVPRTAASLHEAGLATTLRWMNPGQSAKPIVLLGVEPAVVEFGAGLSPALERALPAACAAARTLAENLRRRGFRLPESSRMAFPEHRP